LSFSVNDVELATVKDDRLLSGDIGLAAGTSDRGGARVQFDNLVVRAPEYDGDPDVLFADAFDDNTSGWARGINSDYRQGYYAGHYFIEAKTSDQELYTTSKQSFDAVRIDVDTRVEQGATDSSWGVLCRYQDIKNHYGFEISEDGYYIAWRYEDDELKILSEWKRSDVIERGKDARNHLTVYCLEDTLQMFVNGKELLKIEDADVQSGKVGLVSSVYDTPGSLINFDNFVVRDAGK